MKEEKLFAVCTVLNTLLCIMHCIYVVCVVYTM